MACYVKNTIFELESLLILMHGSFPTPGGVTLQFYKLGIYKSNAEQSDGANTDSYVAGFTDSVVTGNYAAGLVPRGQNRGALRR